MRAFVALELPRSVRSAVADCTKSICRRLPSARWVPVENLHLTIRFLGDLDESDLSQLEKRLRRAFAETSPLDLQLEGGGAYPSGRPARVVWIGLSDPSGLESLSRAVESATAEFTGEQRPPSRQRFTPHVTVARCRKPWPRAAVSTWTSALQGRVGESFRLECGVLMRSRLSPSGARYSVEREFEFGAA